MRKAYRVVLGLGVVASVAAGILAAPRVLPALPGFEVRRVEISGTKLLAPQEVLRSAGIRDGQSVWESSEGWEAALERHPVVAEAAVSRRLPGTLRLVVQEKQPVAYVADGALTPVTAAGERLPVDPTRAVADLPIARGPEGMDGGDVPPLLLSEAERLARMDPSLFAEVSEIRAQDAEGSVFLLRHREADIVIPAGAQADRLVELRSVLADLDGRAEGLDAGGVARIDLRFADQVVVRLPSSVQKP